MRIIHRQGIGIYSLMRAAASPMNVRGSSFARTARLSLLFWYFSGIRSFRGFIGMTAIFWTNFVEETNNTFFNRLGVIEFLIESFFYTFLLHHECDH